MVSACDLWSIASLSGQILLESNDFGSLWLFLPSFCFILSFVLNLGVTLAHFVLFLVPF